MLQVRFRHALFAIAKARHGVGGMSRFEGDSRAGSWTEDHDAEALAVAWNEEGTFVLSVENATYGWSRNVTPASLLAVAPDAIRPLAERTFELTEHRRPTAALFFPGMTDGRETVRVTRRSEPLERLMMDPLALFGGGELGLQCFFGLLDGDGPLALDIATRSMAGPTVITEDEETAILAMSPGELPPRGADVPEAVTLLGAMGVAWPDGASTAAMRTEAAFREREAADPSGGLALLRAIDRRDTARVLELLASGANVDAVSPPDWLDPELGARGGTPLVVAIARGDEAMVHALLDHGADPDGRTAEGWTPLFAAAGWHRAAMCRLLLARGAHLHVEGLTPGQSLVEACRHHPDATVMRVLLDAGVTPMTDDVREELAGQAERLGAPELAARLRGGRS